MRAPAPLGDQWRAATREHPDLEPYIRHFEATLTRHGDAARWCDAIDALPSLRPSMLALGPTVTIGTLADTSLSQRRALARALKALHPWRKGPWSVCGVAIDTEWRSDWKWQRIEPHLAPLAGRRILDVGCGNGYYGWRMCENQPLSVLGVDPSAVYVMQHAAMSRCIAQIDEAAALMNRVLPCRLEELPETAPFDTLFSLGVLYHRRDPLVHLRALRQRLRPGGELVLETLIIRDDDARVLQPDGRYARMRNVWVIPSPAALLAWLDAAGFENARIVDVTATSTDEQRSTEWMRFESLVHALDPTDPGRTIEGHPAPVRAVVLANA
jgi:tRNA (mo5U34)-methyltransferase